jgi:hypothetical protein
MIHVHISRPRKLDDAIQLDDRDLKKIGAEAIRLITRRVTRGMNLSDRPAKALSASWKKHKTKRGKKPIRDLQDSGAMLNALTIIEVGDAEVTIGFTRLEENKKALSHQAREAWFGLSRHDEQMLSSFVSRLFAAKIKKFK